MTTIPSPLREIWAVRLVRSRPAPALWFPRTLAQRSAPAHAVVGNGLTQAQRTRLWSTDGLACMMWPKNLRRLVRITLVSSGCSVHWRTSSLDVATLHRFPDITTSTVYATACKPETERPGRDPTDQSVTGLRPGATRRTLSPGRTATAAPSFRPTSIVTKRSPISAAAELLCMIISYKMQWQKMQTGYLSRS